MLQLIEQTMSSREIAELTGKEHRHVLRDCDVLNANYKKMNLAQIWAGVYNHPNTGNQQHREYLLTRMQTFDLMTGYSVELRIKVNRRWEELEKKNTLDFTNPDTVLKIVQNWKKTEDERRMLKEQNDLQANELKEAAPKVEYFDKVLQSASLVTVNVIAGDLGISAVKLNRLLCDHKIIYRISGTYALYSNYRGLGLAGYRKHAYTDSKGETCVSNHLCWTEKGRKFIIEKFKNFKASERNHCYCGSESQG